MATKKVSRYMQLTPEEKKAYIRRQRKINKKNAPPKTFWANRPHWTETATPEQIQAWKDKMRAGREKFWHERNGTPGRPKRFNYKPGWDPAKKSAATKELHKKHPEIAKKFAEAGQKYLRKRYAKERVYKEELQWVKETKALNDYKKEVAREQEQWYKTAKQVLQEYGVEPEPNMPVSYYKEVMSFFRPDLV